MRGIKCGRERERERERMREWGSKVWRERKRERRTERGDFSKYEHNGNFFRIPEKKINTMKTKKTVKGCIGVKKAARPPEGGQAEIGSLSASNLPLIDLPSGTNARRPSQKTVKLYLFHLYWIISIVLYYEDGFTWFEYYYIIQVVLYELDCMIRLEWNCVIHMVLYDSGCIIRIFEMELYSEHGSK